MQVCSLLGGLPRRRVGLLLRGGPGNVATPGTPARRPQGQQLVAGPSHDELRRMLLLESVGGTQHAAAAVAPAEQQQQGEARRRPSPAVPLLRGAKMAVVPTQRQPAAGSPPGAANGTPTAGARGQAASAEAPPAAPGGTLPRQLQMQQPSEARPLGSGTRPSQHKALFLPPTVRCVPRVVLAVGKGGVPARLLGAGTCD